jgi:predicted DNA-binding transcriptional regulator AlpA
MPEQDIFLAVEAVALRYGVSKRTIARWTEAKSIPAPVRFGERLLRWKLIDLIAWENSQRETKPDSITA